MKLNELVAEKIRQLICDNNLSVLPPVVTLTRHFGVSRSSVLGAIALLKSSGVLVSLRRGGIRVAAHSDRGEWLQSMEHPADILYRDLTEKIADGTIRAGQRLPKLGFYCIERAMSSRSVRGVYVRLVNDGTAFHQGKKWLIGKPEIHSVNVGATHAPPVILVVIPNEDSWRVLCRTELKGRFATQFNRECEHAGIQTFPVLMSAQTRQHLVASLPCGTVAAQRYIRELGNRYLGTLVLAGTEGREPQWVRLLAEYGKPVIVFNPDDIFGGSRPLRYSPAVYYAALDHAAIASVAADSLASSGLHLSGMIGMLSELAGTIIKPAGIRHEFQTRYPHQALVVESEEHLFWENRPDGQTPADVIKRLRRSGIPAIRKILNAAISNDPDFWKNPQLYRTDTDLYTRPILPGFDMSVVWVTHLLVPLFRNHRVTAILTQNDSLAVTCYYWLNAIGVSVPGHISLLSFGNDEILHPLPISSIDFGFDRLGYAAFHLILDDVPVKTDRHGIFRPGAVYINRGSLARSSGLPPFAKLQGEIR
jgi:hypothetical protein